MIFNDDLTCADAPAAPIFGVCCGIDYNIGVTIDRHISLRSAGGNVVADSDSITTIRGYIDCELTAAAAVCGDGDVAFPRGCNDTIISVDGNFVVADQFDGQVLLYSSAERDRATFVALQRQRAGIRIIVGVVV